jgi:uncharacterized membrane protein YbhN (UPF0104 family)
MKNIVSSILLICILFVIPGIGLYTAINTIYSPFGYLISFVISVTLWFSLRKVFGWKIDEKTKRLHTW